MNRIDDTSMDVLIFGTGAMASLAGAYLSRSGRANVTLAGTWNAALAAIGAHGLTVDDGGVCWSAPAKAVSLQAVSPPSADLVIVLVKSYRTSLIAPIAARALAPSALVLTLQNGLGNRESLESACGTGRVAVGVVAAGATVVRPGCVRLNGLGQLTLAEEGVSKAALARVAELLGASGFKTDRVARIEPLLWRKLAVNCAINPLSALLGVPNGALLGSPEPRATLLAAAREVGAVAAAKGLELGVDPSQLALQVAEQTAPNRSSMLQDLDRGAETEIDALCGAVVREARRLGVPTPVNEWLWTEILQRTAGGRPDNRVAGQG